MKRKFKHDNYIPCNESAWNKTLGATGPMTGEISLYVTQGHMRHVANASCRRLIKMLVLAQLVTLICSVCTAQTITFYGTTSGGGSGNGTIFSYSGGTETPLYSFSGGTDGASPQGSLIRANNGLLYGMTYNGGVHGAGTIFHYNMLTGVETDLHDFGSGTDGANPWNTLLQANNGLLYGMTSAGGAYGGGMIFSYNIATGVETDLYDFGNGTDGKRPNGALIQASNGLLYGMTSEGGVYENGIIFSYNIATGLEADLHDFGNGTDGSEPTGSLIQATNGLLYGMTLIGGTNGAGTVFSYNISTGIETDLHDFGSGSDAKNPYGSLMQASNGLIYGMTSWGGAYTTGMMFSYNISTNAYNDLHDFDEYTGDGGNPAGELIQGSDGSLYGLTLWGGASNTGSLINYNISGGTESVLYSFGATGTDGTDPNADLLEVDVAMGPIMGNITLCTGSMTTLSDQATGGTWSSSDVGIVTVGSATGIVTGIAPGAVTISYTLSGYSVTTVVTVNYGGLPAITSVSPQMGYRASSVTISGTGFNTIAADNIVYFGATRANVSTASSTSLSVTVPTDATFMYLSALNIECALTGYSENPFLPTYNNSSYLAGTVNFDTQVPFATGNTPYEIAIGDLDGDGKSDLVVVNTGDNTVSVYLNTSTAGSINTGSFAAPITFATGDAPNDVTIGDVDGDGKPDLVVTNKNDATVSILRNTSSTGSISFAGQVTFATGNIPMFAVIGDIDGDGRPEISVSNRGDNTMSVLRNTSSPGSISFATQVTFDIYGGAANNVVIGDLDGDGMPDLAVTNFSGEVSVLHNTSISGNISFDAQVNFAAEASPSGLAIGDIDGDGKLDLVVSNWNSYTLSVLRNTSTTGSILFATEVSFASGISPTNVAIGDLDGDGKPDMAVANANGGSVSVLRNTSSVGSISFAPQAVFPTESGPDGFAIGDIDGDGKPELVVVEQPENIVAILRNDPLTSIPAITGVAVLCSGSTTSLSDAIIGGTWESDNTSIAVVGSTGTVTGVSAGTATITYAVFGYTVADVVTVNPAPNAGTITGGTSVSVGSYITLLDAVSGGVWSSSNIAIATAGSSSGVVTGTSAGTATISYSVTNECATAIATTIVTVSAAIVSPCTYWTPTGNVDFTSTEADFIRMAFDASGTPYVVFEDYSNSQKASVMKYNGSNWVYVGSPGFSVGEVNYTSIGIDNSGTPYVVYMDMTNGDKATVMKYNGSGWEYVGSPDFSEGIALYDCIAFNNSGTPYVAFIDAPHGYKSSVMEYNGSSWVYVGSPGFSAGMNTEILYNWFAINESGTPYVVYDDETNHGAATVMSYNGTSWANVGDADFSGARAEWPSISINSSGTPYVVFADSANTGRASVMKYTGSNWEYVGIPGFSSQGVGLTSIAIDAAGTPYVGYENSSSETGTVMKYNGSSWAYVGQPSFAYPSWPSIVLNGSGTPYIVYEDFANGLEATVQQLTTTSMVINGIDSVCLGATTVLTDATVGGTWSSSNTSIVTVGSTGLVTDLIAGTATITYMLDGCIATTIITVNSPSAGTVSGPSIVTVGSNITLSDAVTGGSWSAGNSNATVSGGLVTGVTAGTVVISYAVTGVCGTAYATKLVTVNNAAISGITGSTTICAGSATTLSDASTGGTWTSSNSTIANVNSSSGVVTGVAAGTAHISYTAGGVSTSVLFTVLASPLAVNGASSVCVGSTVTLSNSTGGGTWSSSNTATASVSSAGIVSGASAGSVTISYTLSSGCLSTKNITVNVGPTTILGNRVLCLGGTTTLTDATAGGVWTSSNTSVATIGSATGLLTGVGTATAIITYTTGGCYITATVTVSAVPSVILGMKSVCTGSVTSLSDGTTGGTWSTLAGSGGVSLSGTGTVSVTGVTAGTATISYIISTGCSATAIVTVNASPSAIGGNAPVCIGSTLTLTDATGGGTWTSSNSATAAVGSGTGIVTGVAAGVVVITYSTGGSCIATADVTVNATIGAITGVTSLCQGLTVALSDATSGGAWSSSNTATGTVSTTGVVTGLSAGTTNITYAVSGCSRVVTINVNAAPTAINGAFSLCGGTTTTLTDATAGGTWSLTSSLIATIGSATGLVTASSTYAGTTTVSYSSGGCPAVAVLTVSSRPNPIQGATSECVGVTITLSEAIAGGTWSSSNADVTLGSTGGSPVLVTGVTAGAGTITYSLGASCYVTIANTVYADPAPITGPFDVCTGYTVTLSDATGGGAWTSSAPAVASASGYTISGVTAGTATITYKIPTGSCLATQVITVNASPVVTAISGPSSISHATPVTLSDATAGGVWTSSHVAVISLSGSTGSPVTATAAATSGTATISYAVTSGAGCTTTVTKIISATQVPPPHGATTGTTILFAGTIVNLVDDMAAGLWSSSDNGIATVDALGTVTGINPGLANITHTVPNDEGVTTNVTTIEVMELPMNVSIIPNPNKGTFTVNGIMGSTQDEEMTLEVTDVLGQVIYNNKVIVQGGKLSEVITLRNTLANGMYMLNVRRVTDHKVFHFMMEK